ncbi:MAG: alanine racemase [archaeon]
METPHFIFYPEILRSNYREFYESCQNNLKNYKIVYSVKTNPYQKVVKTLSMENIGLELASLEEIKATSKYKKFKILNGPAKSEKELKIAIKSKFLINADSKSEIDKISNILKGKNLEIGLRVSLNESKFGFEIEKIKEIENYTKTKNLQVVSLHFHQGTQLSLKKYKENLEKFSKILSKLNLNLKYINLGGGFPDKFQMTNLNAKLNDYIFTIKENLEKFNSTIILEPGRFLVANSFILLTKVRVIKENFGRNYAILDAGINLLPKISLAVYKFTKADGSSGEKKEYILAGPLLFSNDLLGKFYGNLQEGDIIKIENVGAYCYSLAWEISYKKPKIILN